MIALISSFLFCSLFCNILLPYATSISNIRSTLMKDLCPLLFVWILSYFVSCEQGHNSGYKGNVKEATAFYNAVFMHLSVQQGLVKPRDEVRNLPHQIPCLAFLSTVSILLYGDLRDWNKDVLEFKVSQILMEEIDLLPFDIRANRL
ncbi:hypothetical protein RJT34_28445 [Clitoria ternatea]|uniref:Uncharacterized protein n=1 Tax=Clitoria ternatea TaxID=43366 RepID=A0AAN9F8R9_CLITE